MRSIGRGARWALSGERFDGRKDVTKCNPVLKPAARATPNRMPNSCPVSAPRGEEYHAKGNEAERGAQLDY